MRFIFKCEQCGEILTRPIMGPLDARMHKPHEQSRILEGHFLIGEPRDYLSTIGWYGLNPDDVVNTGSGAETGCDDPSTIGWDEVNPDDAVKRASDGGGGCCGPNGDPVYCKNGHEVGSWWDDCGLPIVALFLNPKAVKIESE